MGEKTPGMSDVHAVCRTEAAEQHGSRQQGHNRDPRDSVPGTHCQTRATQNPFNFAQGLKIFIMETTGRKSISRKDTKYG